MQHTNVKSKCPYSSEAVDDISLLSPAARACPYGAYARIRAEEPIKYLADQDLWIVSKYEDVEYILSNPEKFSSKEALSSGNAYRDFPKALEILKQSRAQPRQRTLILADPPEHGFHRKIVQRALSPAKTLRAFAPTIEARVNGFIDKFIETGRFEVVSQFSIPLPMALVSMIFDVSEEQVYKMKRWSDNFFAALTGHVHEEIVINAAKDTLVFENFVLDRVAQCRKTPSDCFIGRLLQQPEDERPLTDAEIINICSQVLVGGNESTINFISNLVYQIASTIGLEERLREDPARIEDLLEESLRHEPPLQAMYRITRSEMEIGGVRIPKAAKLMLNFGSANRDETFYEDGDEFDLDRDNRETLHMAFGRGIHACAGQTIARREGKIAINVLLSRLRNLRIADDIPPVRNKLFGVRGFQSLHVIFDH
ncbi:cytochrome P450 [Paracoccus onubensis]|uniref:Cytochrome P450 n=1 Tax=Paracoccus onubensis TaxID=1675788 RepID=A0A418SY72_9RHOB|nr:cytochrome P450 [Paracoccus onubensis]RJE85848.1 cytochrome P450 [Paracoccus onubensis]